VSIFRKYKTAEELLPGFLLEKETGIQGKAFSAYNHQNQVFIQWLKERKLNGVPLRNITSENISDFFFYLARDKSLDRTTCEKYFLHVRLFFKYAQKRKELEILPFDLVVFPRKKKDQGAEVIQLEDLHILLPEIKRVDPQLYLACLIQYYCFIRPGKELRLLKIGDIDLHDGIITIRQENAKNKQRQSVTMPQQLIDICIEYGIDKADRSLFIFGNKKKFGKIACSINMLRWRFNKIRDRLNLSKGYKFYSFKHTGASRLHQSGISMREIMDQLRHTKLDATQHYLKKHCGIRNDRIRNNFPSPD
jgi:integrase